MGNAHEPNPGNDQQSIEKPVSAEEREAIIQDIISTQMLAGIEVDYELVAETVDQVFREPMPVLTQTP